MSLTRTSVWKLRPLQEALDDHKGGQFPLVRRKFPSEEKSEAKEFRKQKERIASDEQFRNFVFKIHDFEPAEGSKAGTRKLKEGRQGWRW